MQAPNPLDPTASFLSDVVKLGLFGTGVLLILWTGLKAKWLYPREKAASDAAAAALLKTTCESYDARIGLLTDGFTARLQTMEDAFARERVLLNARLTDAQATAAEWKAQAQSATRVTDKAVTALPVVAAIAPGKTE